MAKSIFGKIFDAVLGETLTLGLSGETSAVADDAVLSLNLPAPVFQTQNVQKAPDSTSGVTVIELGVSKAISRLERQPNARLLRNYAKNSTWVRAAIDYKRRMLGRAGIEIIPADSTIEETDTDKKVRSFIEDVLAHPNAADESYGLLKEQMIEDYLVIGHGCLELDLNRDLTVRGLRVMDAARIGFVKNWDGTDINAPRFVEYGDDYYAEIKRFLAHQQVMCLVNRPMSNTKLGFSHVEALHKTVIALLSGDELLLKQILEPVSEKLISLGEGVTQSQVEEFKYQIRQVRDKLAVVGGAKDPRVLNLAATAEEMRILDGCEWFVRQVAAVFDISTAKLKLSVDTSRANTDSMFEDDLQAIESDLSRIQELENAVFINRYRYLGDVNLEFSYPILNQKDEKQQALIAKIQTGNQGWASTNEARSRTGEKPLDAEQFPFANEILIATREGPVPLSIMEMRWNKMREEIENPPKEEETSGTSEGGEKQ